MPDIVHDFPIQAAAARVFRAVSLPVELDQWWRKKSSGEPRAGAVYELWFGPQFDWQARVTECVAPTAFEFEIVRASPDWLGTRVGCRLVVGDGTTRVRFHHTGWPEGERTLSRLVLLLGDVSAGAEALPRARRDGAL